MESRRAVRVGVTGHRVLELEAGLLEAIRTVLAEISDSNASDGTRRKATLVAVSPLAEGADRIVAREILATPGGELRSLLPLEPGEYAKDFTSPDSHDEFLQLLERSISTTVLDLQVSRDEAYRLIGEKVVDACDVLIAIWDGAPARGTGGTAETVAYARARNKPLYLISPRAPFTISREGDSVERFPSDSALKTEEATPFENMNGISELGPGLQKSILAVGGDAPSSVVKELTDRMRIVYENFGPPYNEAGIRSESYQRRYRLISKAVFFLAPLAVLIVASQFILDLSHWVVAGEFGAISIILAVTTLGNRRGWHMTWLESRLQAEWFRHGMFVAFLSGQTTPGIDRHWACRWVADTQGVARLRSVWKKLPHLGSPPEESLVILKDFMRKIWLEEQREYHQAKTASEIRNHRRIRLAGEIAFWGTFFAAALHMTPHSVYHSAHLDYDPIIRVLTMLAIGLPTIGAAFTGLQAHFEYKKIAARSAMMAEHLHFLIQDLQHIESIGELGQLVQETEMLMLQENSDWYFTLGLHELEKG